VRILIVVNNIQELGGAQRVSYDLADAWGSAGHGVELLGITPHPEVHPYPTGPFRARTLMNRVWPAKSGTPLTAQERAQRTELRAQAVSAFRDVLVGEPGVIVVTQVWGMEILNDPALDDVRAQWRIIGQYHGSFAAAASGRDLARIVRSYQTIDRMVALTQEDAEAFVRHGLACEGMPNSLAQWPVSVPTERPRIITYLGRLAPEKAPDIAVKAWERIHDQLPQWSLHLVGSGPMEAQLRAHHVPRMQVLPPVSDPGEVLQRTSILALPSYTEGFPLTLAEACAWGIPAVATDCSSGVRELMGGHGLLVPPGDADAFGEALVALASQDQLRLDYGNAARAHAESYRRAVVMESWADLFSRVMR